MSPVDLQRRRWLKRSGATLAAALGAGTLGNLLLGARPAHAADYKALVCVFLYGGNDGLNTVVPTDGTRYAQYSGVRGGLAIPQASLVALGGTGYGLHPSLSALAPVWNEGRLAPVFNVGPLHQPLTKAQFRAAPENADEVPDNLFSHSDQQVLWESGTTDSTERTGWGGRAAATLATVNPVISLGGSARFGLSSLRSPLVLPGPGSVFGAYGLQPDDLQWAPMAARKAAIDALYAEPQELALADAYAGMQRDAFAVSQRLGAIVKLAPGASAAIDSAFAPLIVNGELTSEIAQQLYQVAKLVQGNATVQGNRQLFFAEMGGFDTHGNQITAGNPLAGEHASLLKELGDALAAFHQAMKNIGLADAVTTFTQSDFGRTFVPNNSNGTDHAWGNHHLVIGGAVKGGTTYGTYPQLVLGGPDDVGVDSWELQGRWIPTSSVDQYAATLLGWFGASEAQLDAVLPNLKNFGAARRLGFL
ncbi:MAG TPA: DUF1501 domain-containing protein [Albitalea sp.]|uniref:DUF1501 domain-containing protein n=1 Tax=Piscinibacter sp. TaxID=1903157 RepID=UPI002ED1B4C0